MQEKTTNTPESVNERPANGVCTDCGRSVEPYLRPAFQDIPAKWLAPQNCCDSCTKRREARDHAQQQQTRIDQAFRNSRISPRFRERTFANFEITPGTAKPYDVARAYKPNSGGLLFFGPVGTGKTHLAAAISNRLIGTVESLFVSCPALLLELREAMHDRQRFTNKKSTLLNIAKTVCFLVLDDIGAEKTSEWVQETLFVLINHRYEFKLPTVFTTNCTVNELEKKLGPRIASRIVEMCRCLEFSGPDYRLKKRKQEMEGGPNESV